MMAEQCGLCGGALSGDEAALYRKLICRSAEKCLCLRCLSAKLGLSKETLAELIERYRRMGCELFSVAEEKSISKKFDYFGEKA